MDVDVFDVFDLSQYTFLQLERGTVAGNVITNQVTSTGVFKIREGMVTLDTQETARSDATLHVRSYENFVEDNNGNLVGHGIRVNNRDYEIVGQTGGKNYHNGNMEHFRLTLQYTDFSDWVEPS